MSYELRLTYKDRYKFAPLQGSNPRPCDFQELKIAPISIHINLFSAADFLTFITKYEFLLMNYSVFLTDKKILLLFLLYTLISEK